MSDSIPKSVYDIEEALENCPSDWALALSLRAALRILPTIDLSRNKKDEYKRLFLIFRHLIIAKEKLNSNISNANEKLNYSASLIERDLYGYLSTDESTFSVIVAVASVQPRTSRFNSFFRAIIAAGISASPNSNSNAFKKAEGSAGKLIMQDFLALERGTAPVDLVNKELNPIIVDWNSFRGKRYYHSEYETDIVEPFWRRFSSELLKLDRNWSIWTDWWEAMRDGRPPWGLPREVGDKLTYDFVTWPEEKWQRPPAEINADIAAMIETARAGVASEESKPLSLEDVPPQRPAAVEPEWQGNRLVLPTRMLATDLDDAGMMAALASLRSGLSQLADDAELESNIDKRAVRKMRRLAELVPQNVPDQATLFTLGHAQEAMREFHGIVVAEWPDVLASDYSVLLKQFDRTTRQFPRWREFIRNANKNELTAGDAAEIAEATDRTIEFLRDEVPALIVDPAIPSRLERLRDMMPSADEVDQIDETIRGALEEVALDLLESIDNTLKRLAEKMIEGQLAASRSLGNAAGSILLMWQGKTLAEARKALGGNFAKALKKSSGEVGKMAGENFPYVVISGLIYAVLIALGFPTNVAGPLAASPWTKKLKWVRDLLKKLERDPN